MEETALQLKSHETRFEACRDLLNEMRDGTLTEERQEEILSALNERWVEQHDSVGKLTYFSVLTQFPEYLNKNYEDLLQQIRPFIYNPFSPKNVAVFRTPAVALVVEIIKKLSEDGKWRSIDLESKVVRPFLMGIIDKTSAEFDLTSAVKIGLALFENGHERIVPKLYGSTVEREIDLVLNENLIQNLIHDSITRMACDPTLKKVLNILCKLEKQSDVSKKVWKKFFELGNSKNTLRRALFFECMLSFIENNQNRRIFRKILKTQAMHSIVSNMDDLTAKNPFYTNVINELSQSLAKLNEDDRFRKIIFPSPNDAEEKLADVSKLVIFATGASENVFNFIRDLPHPYPQGYLLNINNLEPETLSSDFLLKFFDFAFIQTISEEDFEELENGDVNGNMDSEEVSSPLEVEQQPEEDDEAIISDLIVDEDELTEEAQLIFVKTIGRCARRRHMHLISDVVDHYRVKIDMDDNSREVLQTVFPEAESKLRIALFALRDKLIKIQVDDERLALKKRVFQFFVESLLLHQLFIPSLLAEDSQIVEDLDNFVAVVFGDASNEKGVNPVEVLLDLMLQLITIDDLLSPTAGFCLKYFLEGNLNYEILDMMSSLIRPALSGEQGGEIFDPGMIAPEDVMEDEDEEDPSSLAELEDRVENSEDEGEHDDDEMDSESVVNAMANGDVSFENDEDFDQDEHMFKNEESLKAMFLQRKRELDRQKTAASMAKASSFSAASAVLQLIELFVRHTPRADEALHVFNHFLRMYINRLRTNVPKKFSAQTHQQILHLLSTIYKSSFNFSMSPESAKEKKKTDADKFFGRVDSILPKLINSFFHLSSLTHKVNASVQKPIFDFFRVIFTEHPDCETIIVPVIEKRIRKQKIFGTNFNVPKAMAFLVSLPLPPYFIVPFLYPSLKRFFKTALSALSFMELGMSKHMSFFERKDCLEEFTMKVRLSITKDIEKRLQNPSKACKKLVKTSASFLNRITRKHSSLLTEASQTNILSIATQLKRFNTGQNKHFDNIIERLQERRPIQIPSAKEELAFVSRHESDEGSSRKATKAPKKADKKKKRKRQDSNGGNLKKKKRAKKSK